MKTLLLAGAVMASVACQAEPAADVGRSTQESEGGARSVPQPSTPPSGPTTTTTEAPPEPSTTTTTEAEPEPATTVASVIVRRTTTTVEYYEPSPQSRTVGKGSEPPGNDFWYALATCESENGRTSANQFQFMGGTAEKVGYYTGASYAEQRAMAQGWAATLRAEGTHPGSSAGWPECWWQAGGS
jgi:hypothetical protein